MTAAKVDLYLDQGADFLCQLYWLDQNSVPMVIAPPIRMEIRTIDSNTIVKALQSGSVEEGEDENYAILFNADSGLIQIHLDSEDTSEMSPGQYVYDLFTSYSDRASNAIRRHRLIQGTVNVSRRVTLDV